MGYMGSVTKAAGLATLGVFGALGMVACGPTQLAAAGRQDAAQATTAPLTGKKTADPPRLPVSTTTPGPAGDPVPVTHNVEIESSDGEQVTVRNAVHVNGGPNNGHWETTGPTHTVRIGYDTDYYAALSLCPGGDGVTLDDHGAGNRPCDPADAIAALHQHGAGMMARITFDGDDTVTDFREIYVP